MLQKLLDDIRNGKKIQEIINEYLIHTEKVQKDRWWLYYLIKHKEMWGYNYIRIPNADKRFDEIQLTIKITTNKAIECYTYALYCEFKNTFNIEYQYGNSNNTIKMGISFNDNKLFVWGFSEDVEEPNEKKYNFYVIDKNSTKISGQDECISSNTKNINEKFKQAIDYLESKLKKAKENQNIIKMISN